MQRQRERDTGPELALRRALFRRGLRYHIHRRPLRAIRREIDVVFPTERVAVEVRGCFWHVCPKHASWPQTNAVFWREKLERNAERDAETERAFRNAGWKFVVVWEHEDPDIAASLVAKTVRARRQSPS